MGLVLLIEGTSVSVTFIQTPSQLLLFPPVPVFMYQALIHGKHQDLLENCLDRWQ